jgi:hypothetical protein
MSMISYSSDLIFREDFKYVIRIDMRGPVLHLLKIEILTSHLGKRSKRLIMSQEPTLYAQNPDLKLGAQLVKNRKYLHDPRKSVIRLKIMQGPILYDQNFHMSLQSLSPKK